MTGSDSSHGPVPVRDLLRQLGTEAAPESQGAEERARAHPEADAGPVGDAGADEAADAPEAAERAFEMDGVEWVARPAGSGCYGTGRRGMALLLAVHFYRADDPDRPVREALLPGSRLVHLRPEELQAVFDEATPIELPD